MKTEKDWQVSHKDHKEGLECQVKKEFWKKKAISSVKNVSENQVKWSLKLEA